MNKVNFKKWAFHFMVWIIIINIIITYSTINYNALQTLENAFNSANFMLNALALFLLILSLLFIILSIIKKEKQNYQFWIAAVGILFFGVLPFFISIFNY